MVLLLIIEWTNSNTYLIELREEEYMQNKTQLQYYLEESYEDITIDLYILALWKLNIPKFKVLSLRTRDIFAISVSIVALELVFSKSGRVLNQFRNCLSPPIMEALICAQDWLTSSPTSIQAKQYLEDSKLFYSC